MENDKYNKILVTGAGGLIGGYVVKTLYNTGYEVTATYRNIPKKNRFAWSAVEVDLSRSKSLLSLGSLKTDWVVHCAAMLPRQFEGEEAKRTSQINQQIDEQVIHFSKQQKCKLIYSSSTSVYKQSDSIISEDSAVLPRGPYCLAKFESERRLSELCDEFLILRTSSPFGKEQRSRTVLRTFIERAVANLDIYYFGSGKRQQNFIAAEDVARAIKLIISNNNSSTGVFNITYGKSISMRDLAELVVKTVERTASRVIPSGKPDPQEDYRCNFDISKAKKLLGWEPLTSLEAGIRNWSKSLVRSF